MKIRILIILWIFKIQDKLIKMLLPESARHQLFAPSEYLRDLVTEAWSHMNPHKSEAENDYDLAFELNAKAYQQGHPEGATNIGLLYEKGWGVERNFYLAEQWYLKAIGQTYHSAEAELGLVRIYLSNPLSKDNKHKVMFYIGQSKKTALVDGSLWSDAAGKYLNEADLLEAQFKNLQHY
jgi:TPR repeat protein